MSETSDESDSETHILKPRPDAFNTCIEQLNLEPNARKPRRLIPYLNTLIPFIQVLKHDNINFLDLLKQTAMIMKHEHQEANKLIMRNGDKGTQFYVILSGKISILVVIPEVFYLNDIEYITHLLKLRKNDELELIRQCMFLNNRHCPFEDNFDQWMKNVTNTRGNKPALFSDNKEIVQMVEMVLYYLKKNKEPPRTTVTVEEYIQMNHLDNTKYPQENRRAFQIPVYQRINQIETGQTFGYMALESKSNKRTASLITMNSVDLGVIEKSEYELLIKNVNEKARKKFYNLIMSYSIYQDIAKVTFDKRYFNWFVYQKIERGCKLIIEGQANANVYFLLKGEFELYTKKNIVEVNNLIIALKEMIRKLNKKKNQDLTPSKDSQFDEEKENEDLIINKEFRVPEHNKILFERKLIKLGLIKDRDIIGLLDCVEDKSKIGLITCSCVSVNSEAYIIPQESFDSITYHEPEIRGDLRQFQEKKINYLIERLITHKQMVTSEITKNDKDLTRHQRNADILLKNNTMKNRLYTLEANSKFNAENLTKPLLQNKLPLINTSMKDDYYYTTEASIHPKHHNKTAMKPIKLQSKINSDLGKCKFLMGYKNSIIRRHLYDNLFHSYLNSEDVKLLPPPQTERRYNPNKPKEQSSHILYSSCTTDTRPSRNRIAPRPSPVNFIDCLIMDKFNNCYTSAMKSFVANP